MNGLLIGRFQPFHFGHLEALKFALSYVDHLWLGIGSSNKPTQKNNPFSASERRKMIKASIDSEMIKRIRIFDIPDLENHEKWIKNIDSIVPKYEIVFTNDDLTQYLYSKRKIRVIVIPFTQRDVLSGTNIRDRIQNNQNWDHLVPKGTKDTLDEINAKARLKSL